MHYHYQIIVCCMYWCSMIIKRVDHVQCRYVCMRDVRIYTTNKGGGFTHLVTQCKKLLAMVIAKANYPPFTRPSALELLW